MLRTTVQALYAKVLTDPRVNLALLEPVEQVVYVGGEIRAYGGVVAYRPGLTLFRAILASGSPQTQLSPPALFAAGLGRFLALLGLPQELGQSFGLLALFLQACIERIACGAVTIEDVVERGIE